MSLIIFVTICLVDKVKDSNDEHAPPPPLPTPQSTHVTSPTTRHSAAVLLTDCEWRAGVRFEI